MKSIDNNSPASYYQKKARKGYKKSLFKIIRIFPKKKNKISINVVVNNIKILPDMKNKVLLNIEKFLMKFVKVSCNSFSNHS